jgi:ADP-ribose pyrophosphatase
LARGLTPGDRRLDDEEFLDVFAASLHQMKQWIDDGTITDVKTIIAVYHLIAKNILQ